MENKRIKRLHCINCSCTAEGASILCSRLMAALALSKPLTFGMMLLLVLGFMFQSCLDEDLPATATMDDITDEDDVDMLAKGMYSALNSSDAFKVYGFFMLAASGDDLYGKQTYGFGDRTFTSVQTSNMWEALFKTIGRSNNVLKMADIVEAKYPARDGIVLDRYRGEAYFVRAFCYYYLVQMFGAVPLRLEPFTEYSTINIPRTEVEKVYSRIFADLELANRYCPPVSSMSGTEIGRATKGAAQALMASASLVFANWLDLNHTTDYESRDKDYYYDQSIHWCDSVIISGEYSLFDDYSYLWNVVNEPSLHKEVIYSIQYTVDQISTGAGSSGSEYAFRYLPKNYPNGVGTFEASGYFEMLPGFINDYWTDDTYVRLGDRSQADSYPKDEVDYRLETSFLTQWNNATGRSVHACPFPHAENSTGTPVSNITNSVAKYIDANSRDKRNSGNDLNIFRLSEIYLIRAEAKAELGDLEGAVGDLNMVRKRARRRGTTDDNHSQVPKLLQISDIKDSGAFRTVLLKERGLELVGECDRWLDLVRMKSPDGTQTMFEYRFSQLSNSKNYSRIQPSYNKSTYSWANASYINWDAIKPIVEYTGKPNKFLLFPIPESEMSNNPAIMQNNPGW